MTTIFDNTNPQPGIGPITGTPGNACALAGDTLAFVASASTTTTLVYGLPWTGIDDTGGLTVTISGTSFTIHANAGNDTDNPITLQLSGGTAAASVTAAIGVTVTMFDTNGSSGTFTVPSFNTTTSGSGGGGGFLSNEDPRFTNVSFTKTEDDHVTLTFDFDEMDGNLSNYVVHKKALDGTETNSSDQGISGSSGTHTKTGAQIPILDGLSDGDQLWLEHSSNPIHIVWSSDGDGTGYGGILDPYVHKVVDWSVENVNGVKSVVARFFGVDTGQTFDHELSAYGPSINEYGSTVVHDGTLKTISHRYKKGKNRYWIKRHAGSSFPQYGSDFYTEAGGKVHSNFW